MSEKRYCFIPEEHKDIKVYNAGLIHNFKGSEEIKNITPTVNFRHCIDIRDKAKLFYIDTQNTVGSSDDSNYFKYKTMNALKAIYNVTELHNYKLILDEDARIEFTIFYDKDGNWIPLSKLYEKNKYNTVIGHTYTYMFYKRYSN